LRSRKSEVKDCPTWFLVVFKPKMTYPLPPRFSAREVLLRVFGWVFWRGLVRRFAVLHVESCTGVHMQFWRLKARLRDVCVRKQVSVGTLGRQNVACLGFGGLGVEVFLDFPGSYFTLGFWRVGFVFLPFLCFELCVFFSGVFA